jgi:hypothetical protein
MKVKFVLFLVFFSLVSLISLSLVYATCPSNQIIMKLYLQNNSHGALWNDTAYSYDICYSDIFGTSGNGNHACTGTNRVLSMYGIKNAHASVASDVNYNVNICYGDLTCQPDTSSGNSCTNGGRVVVRLFQNNNSHISYLGDAHYLIKICCTAGTTGGAAFWANMVDSPITTADINDTVKLIWPVQGIDGTPVKFEIYEKDLVDDGVRTGDDAINTVVQNGRAVASWDITQEDYDSTGGLGEGEDREFYFTAKVGDDIKNQSGILTVNHTYEDTLPFALILTPQTGEVYKLNQIINFTAEAYDVDDSITTLWNFGDSQTSPLINTTHTYNLMGQKNIRFEVTNKRNKMASDRASILVCGGGSQDEKCLFAYISRPSWREVIVDTNVIFNATETFALSYNAVTQDLTCIAGKCPSQTADGTIILPGTINADNMYDNLTFNWTFLPLGDADKKINKIIRGQNGVLLNQEFDTPSTLEHPHRAMLTVTLEE